MRVGQVASINAKTGVELLRIIGVKVEILLFLMKTLLISLFLLAKKITIRITTNMWTGYLIYNMQRWAFFFLNKFADMLDLDFLKL